MMNRVRYTRFVVLFLSALLWGAGCAPPFSKQILEKVDRNITFHDLKENPDKYKGRWIMLAGVIVDAKNTKDGTFIEVLQKPMDSQGRPLRTDATEGRFIIASEKFLDSAIYHKGRLLTVVGEVSGQKVLPLGEIEYRYPLVAAKDLHLWEPYTGPTFHFGIGVWHQL